MERVFIAMEISADVRRAVGRWVGELRGLGVKVSWVVEENLHVTLVFVGEIDLERVGVVGEVLAEEAMVTPAFGVEVVGVGTFGSARMPRVVWVGVEAPPVLADVQGRLTARLLGKGFAVERRAFRPHLTVGRVRGREGVGALTSAVGSATDMRFGEVAVRRLVLLRSDVGPGGARYTVVRACELNEE